MNINYTKILRTGMVICLLLAAACTGDFEELNSNPNNPTVVSAQYLLPQALQTSIDNYWGNKARNERLNFDHAMSWVGYLTRNIYENEGDNYNVQPSVNIKNWEVFYTDGLVNFQRIATISAPDGSIPNPTYEGIGIGMRAWVFSLITDVWGAIPYTEALAGTSSSTAIYSPGYDTQEEVYAGLITDLKTANEKIDASVNSIQGDIMFNGNALLWKKFFNSLRFKLLNRQATKVSGSAAEMQAMIDDPATFPMIDSNDEMSKFSYGASLGTQNPWNDILIVQGRADWNISSTLVDKLKSLNDPRLEVYAIPGEDAGGEITGHPNGLPGNIAVDYVGYSAIINPEFFAQATSPAVLMSYAELLFLKAEAAFDGDITGDAQAYFDAGITASFAQYGLTTPPDYIANLGPADKENIMTQKWIALFGQGIEAWTELRRTGFPVMPAHDPQSLFFNDGVLPTRLIYPSTEYSLNGGRVIETDALNGGADDMKTKLWWAE